MAYGKRLSKHENAALTLCSRFNDPLGACRISGGGKSNEDGARSGCQLLEWCKCSLVRNRTASLCTFWSACKPNRQRPFRKIKLTRIQGVHYGTPQANSLHLLRHYFEQYAEDAKKVVLSIKGAYDMKEGPDGSPEGIRASVEEALKVLPPSIKPIDVFECARVDPKVPIETSIKALADLVKEGKIRGIGLSEASANTIRKAHAVYPISAVEIELSLFTPDPLHNGIVETCHERTYSPSRKRPEVKEKRIIY